MVRGTTPTHYFTFPFDLSGVKELLISYCQKGKVKLEKRLEDITVDDTGKTASFQLTQQETLAFAMGEVEIQCRVLASGQKALVSDKMNLYVEEIIRGGVMDAE